MSLNICWIVLVLAAHTSGVLPIHPFLDKYEANNFLSRSRRSNKFGSLFEEFLQGNQERECIEEDCNLEEAYETVDNNDKGRQFWDRYQRCRQVRTLKSASLKHFIPSHEDEVRIRVSRQIQSQAVRSLKFKDWLRKCIGDTDQCTPFPCVSSNTEECVDSVADFECVCKAGFTGRKCESPVNECLSNPCTNSGRCEDEIGGFTCICDSLHEGILCENEINDCRNVETKRCALHGRCLESRTGEPYSCVCDEGFRGIRCNEDIDECSESSPCDQICKNTVGSFTCTCEKGYLLDLDTMRTCRDIDECNEVSHGCQHECVNTLGGYHCKCKYGYELDNVYNRYCEDVDECATDNAYCPIIEGGCGVEGVPCQTCANTDGSFTCYCPVGFSIYERGKPCVDIDECEGDAHGCEQNCENFQGGYQCRCNEGYQLGFRGKTCSDVNECRGEHGCEDRCVNNIGSYECTCPRGYVIAENKRSCEDVNECRSGVSKCSQICVNTKGSYECACNPGSKLLGKYGCTDINECLSDPCGRNGRCINGENHFQCDCNDGFSGNQCEFEENPCANNPCLHSGTCAENASGFTCECADGYTGDTCQELVATCDDGFVLLDDGCVDVDECLEDGICEHICHNTPGSYVCSCREGYEAEENHCNDVNECMDSPCQEKCINNPGSYTCMCGNGLHLSEDGRNCEKQFLCTLGEPAMVADPHFLLGTRKNDFVSTHVRSVDSTFSFEFKFRTFDQDSVIVVLSDQESRRYLIIALFNGRLKLIANIDGTQKETVERARTAKSSDGKWHKVAVRKRKNRIRSSKDGRKLRDLRFDNDDFSSVNMWSYGGFASSTELSAEVQQLSGDRFQGCLQNFSYSGVVIDDFNETLPVHSGCFERILQGMYFTGSGHVSLRFSTSSELRMRFSFRSRKSRGIIAGVESEDGDAFSLYIQGNQLIAEVTKSTGQSFSSIYTTDTVESLCNDVWHTCYVTVSSNTIRMYVDGIAAQAQAVDSIPDVSFGDLVTLNLGGKPGSSSDNFAGSLRSFRLNNKPLDVESAIDYNGAYLFSMPL